MNLTTLSFMLFCIIIIGIYFLISKKYQWIILLISSCIFLFYNNLTIATVIQALLVLLTSYFFGLMIEKEKSKKKYLILGVTIILGQLIYLKYSNLFLESINHILKLFNLNYSFKMVTHNSLIGISYYSLIMISYLIDIYRGACKAQKNIFKCALFMSYFPILTSGPFIRYDDIKSDLYGKHKFDFDRFCSGLLRSAFGLFKILVISQRLGMFVDAVYGNPVTYHGFYIMLASVFFTLQLYTNFSGSIDIIMGVSEIFGIKLPENFKAPFFSRTITEFWRNWHITLGAWLRDYIFYPLLKSDFMQKLKNKYTNRFGKKVGKKIPMYLSMLIMWILIGIWHGGAYTFIIGVGLLQFLFIFLEDILTPFSLKINKKLGIDTEAFSYKLYQCLRTFLLFSFSLIFFRAESVSKAFNLIRYMFSFDLDFLLNGNLFSIGLDVLDFIVLIVALVVLIIVEILSLSGSVREKFFRQNIVFRWVVAYVLIFSIIIFGCYGVGYDPAAFIYRNF